MHIDEADPEARKRMGRHEMKNLLVGCGGGVGQFCERSENNMPCSQVAKRDFSNDEWMDDDLRLIEQTRQYRVVGA